MKHKIPDQKVLVLDIEWRPTIAYVWQAWDESTSPEKIIEHGGLLCVGAKWLGEKEVHLFSEWEHGHEGMLAGIHEMMSFADAIITYNGDKYDLPKLDGEFVLYNFPPRPPCTSIDVIKAVKKLGYFRSSLGFVGPFLGLGDKVEYEGFGLWKKVMKGDKNAQERMGKYCIQDVKLTEKLYLKLRPHIKNHPHLGRTGHEACPVCGSSHVHSKGSRPKKEEEIDSFGTRRTRVYKIQRLQCQTCTHWYDGKRMKI